MLDSYAATKELIGLIDSLRENGTFLREWSRQVKARDDDEGALLCRQLDRAAQFLDQAVRALRSTDAPEPAIAAPTIPGFTGTTSAIPLSSLVSFLADVGVSGVLRLYAADEDYVLQFDHGYLIYAFGDNPPDGLRLGELLVRQGAIHGADLLRVLDEGWSTTETLGGLLVSGGYVEQEELQAALEVQIQELGKRLFAQGDARFRFYPDERVVAREDVRMNVMGLLLETARVRDEELRGRNHDDEDESAAKALFDLDVA